MRLVGKHGRVFRPIRQIIGVPGGRPVISAGQFRQVLRSSFPGGPERHGITPQRAVSANKMPGANSWQDVEADLWVRALVAGLVLKNTVFGEDHPTTVRLQHITQRLRQAANRDAVFAEARIDLPDKFVPVPMESDALEAFVFPTHPSHVFITTGLIRALDAAEDLIAAILAHENGHAIFYELQKRAPGIFAKPTERFGETLFFDGFISAMVEKTPWDIPELLRSKPEEHWCDIHGAFPVLSGAGINPEAMGAAQRKLLAAKHKRDQCAFEKKSLLGVATDSLGSHPELHHRIWVTDYSARVLAYPETIRKTPISEKCLLPAQTPSLASSTEAAAQFFLDHTAFRHWYGAYVLGHMMPALPPDLIFTHRDFSDEFGKLTPAQKKAVLAAGLHFFTVLPLRIIGLDIRKIKTSKKDPEAFKRFKKLWDPAVALYKANRKTAHKIDRHDFSPRDSLIQILFDNWLEAIRPHLPDELSVEMVRLFAVFDRRSLSVARMCEAAASVATPSRLLNLGDYLPEMAIKESEMTQPLFADGQVFSGQFLWGEIRNKHQFCKEWDAKISLTKEPMVVEVEIEGKKSSQLGEIANVIKGDFLFFRRLRIKRFLAASVRRFAKDRFWSSFSEALTWLQSFCSVHEARVSAFGPLATAENLFAMAVEIALHLPERGTAPPTTETLRQRFRHLQQCGYHPGKIYPQQKVGVPSNRDVKPGTFFWTVHFQVLREFFPHEADRLLYDFLGARRQNYINRSDRRGDALTRRKIKGPGFEKHTLLAKAWFKWCDREEPFLRLFSEPAFFISFGRNMERQTLPNDIWALQDYGDPQARLEAEKNREKAEIRIELQRGSRTMAEYLCDLQSRPTVFSALIWRKMAKSAVHSFSDWIAFFNHVKGCMAVASDGSGMHWRKREFLASLVAVFVEGLNHLESTQPGFATHSEVTEEVTKMLRAIPRHSKRNLAVTTWMSHLANTNPQHPDLLALGQMIETEPHAELVQERLGELRRNHNPHLVDCELEIELSEKAFVPEEELLADQNHQQALVKAHFDLKRGRLPAEGKKNVFERVSTFWEDFFNPGIDLFKKAAGRRGVLPPHYVVCLQYKDFGFENNEFQTPTQLRYKNFVAYSKTTAAPTAVIDPVTQSVRCAEASAALLAPLVGINPDVLQEKPFSRLSTREDFWLYVNQKLKAVQPVPTPLRDRWMLLVTEHFQTMAGLLRPRDLRRLQKLMYLPENIEALGEMAWVMARRTMGTTPSATKRSRLIGYVEALLPFYSDVRNRVLKELRQIIGPCDETTARRLSVLHWTPGLPAAKPGTASLGGSSLIDFQASLLSTLDDVDVVEFLCFGYKLSPTRPWSVSWLEHLLGGKLDRLLTETQNLNSSAQRALLHRIFGGGTGIFSRGDRPALRTLARYTAGFISSRLPKGSVSAQMVEACCHDIFWRAGFPVVVRTEVLCSLVGWVAQAGVQGELNEKKIANLIYQLFAAIKPAGPRFLQGLLMEPHLFSESIKDELRTIYDEVEPGDPAAPIHLAAAQGLGAIELGPRLGAGSMAEVYEVAPDVAAKFTRSDTLGLLTGIAEPMKVLATTIQSHGFGWSEKSVTTVIESCVTESDLTSEAQKTAGMAATIAQVLGGEPTDVEINVPGGSPVVSAIEITPAGAAKPLTVVVPKIIPEFDGRKVAQAKGQTPLVFLLSHLGREVKNFSRLQREAIDAGKDFSEVVTHRGLNLEDVAVTMCLLFLKGFFGRGWLFKDLHVGNAAGVALKSRGPALALLDFGGVDLQFPVEWKNWLIRLLLHARTGHSEELKRDLLEIAFAAEGEAKVTKAMVEKLEDLLKNTQEAMGKRTAFSMAGVLEDTAGLIQFLLNDWPLTPPIREFCEGIRKVLRQWLPHISSQRLSAMGNELTAVMIAAAISAGIRAPAVQQRVDIFLENLKPKPELTKDEVYSQLLAENKIHNEFYGEGRFCYRFPGLETFIHVWQPACDDKPEHWKTYTVISSAPLENPFSGSFILRCRDQNTSVREISPQILPKCYIEVREAGKEVLFLTGTQLESLLNKT